MTVGKWFRIVLFTTAGLNIPVALTFIPAYRTGREKFGFPETHPAYLRFIAALVLAFGLSYFWMALKQKREWLFVAVAAIGKLFAAFAGFRSARRASLSDGSRDFPRI